MMVEQLQNQQHSTVGRATPIMSEILTAQENLRPELLAQ